MDQDTLVTVTGAARLLQVHVNTIRNWCRKGVLHPRRDWRGWRVFKVGDLLAFNDVLTRTFDSTEERQQEAKGQPFWAR
jgi:DNA-binding transcriptional MerR regulator